MPIIGPFKNCRTAAHILLQQHANMLCLLLLSQQHSLTAAADMVWWLCLKHTVLLVCHFGDITQGLGKAPNFDTTWRLQDGVLDGWYLLLLLSMLQ